MSNRLFDSDGVVVNYAVGNDATERAIEYDLQSATASMGLDVGGYCIGDATSHVAGPSSPDTNPSTYTVTPFSAVVSAFRNVRCALGEEAQIAQELFDNGATVAATEFALWNSVPRWDNNVAPSLQNVDVSTLNTSTLPASANHSIDVLAFLLIRRAALTPLDNHVIHLGLRAAMTFTSTGQVYADSGDTSAQLRLRATDSPVVVSPYYPDFGMAVTGPIQVTVGETEAHQEYDISQNRTRIRAYKLCSIGFDPATAVRAV